MPGLDLFFDIAGELLFLAPYGDKVEKAVDIIEGALDIKNDILDLMAAPPSKAITPSLSQMSHFVAEVFNRWAINVRAGYENVLGATYSTKHGSQTNLAIEGRIFEVPTVRALQHQYRRHLS